MRSCSLQDLRMVSKTSVCVCYVCMYVCENVCVSVCVCVHMGYASECCCLQIKAEASSLRKPKESLCLS